MILRVEHLHKKYGDVEVLRDINFDVSSGEVVALIGASGSGKSTLLRCISRLLNISSGCIYFDGVKINDIGNFYQKVGMVFQQFNLFNNLSVMDNIILAPVKLKLMSKDEALDKARKLLLEVGLLDKENVYPRSLSGGEAQRVAIVRTLIMNPSIILFDEPTSSLDPKMTKDVLDLIKKLIDKGITIILVSHELKFVKEVSSRVIFIKDGSIVTDTSCEEAFNNPKNIYLKEFVNSMM